VPDDGTTPPDLLQRLDQLDPKTRRRTVRNSVLRSTFIAAALFAIYFILPVQSDDGGRLIARVLIGVIAFVVVIAYQIRRIIHAPFPGLRAVEAVAIALPLLLVMFAGAYASLSYGKQSTFSQPLDQVRALYFTITTFATVGYGDITPTTNATRMLVSFQMLLDVAALGVIVRLLFGAAKIGLQGRISGPDD
jgi:hypothetical protein